MALRKPFDILRVSKEKPRYVRYLEVDLTTQLTNQEFRISGDFIQILDCTGNATIRLNEETNPEIDARKIDNITTPFYRFFVTTKGNQAYGKIKMIIGADAAFQIVERPASFEVIMNEQSWSVSQGTTDTIAVDISGYRKISLFMVSDKVGVFRISTQPISTFDYGTYNLIEVIPFLRDASTDVINRTIEHPCGSLQISFSDDDTADDATVKIIVIGEK